MKTLLLLAVLPLVWGAAKRDVGGPPSDLYDPPQPPQDQYQPPPQDQYQPPPQDLFQPQPNVYEPPQLPQYNFNHFQPNYEQPAGAWGVSAYEQTSIWSVLWDKGLEILTKVVPITLSLIVVISVLSFLGLIKIPLLRSFDGVEVIGRALSNMDMDQVASTVHMAIDKYERIFGQL